MKASLFATLEKTIEDWLDERSGLDDWTEEINVIVGQQTAHHMAIAAASVLDACEESQEHGIEQGFFKE